MQKVAQRAERAQRSASRRRVKTQALIEKGDRWQRESAQIRIGRHWSQLKRDERRSRREDWALGSLAPRRDVGEFETSYGALPAQHMTRPDRDPKRRPEWFPFTEGDRVVILRGRDYGRIGTIKSVELDRSTVTVKGLNLIDVALPAWFKSEQNYQRDVSTLEQELDYEDVKLVYPLPHPETGVIRDVVIDRLECINRETNKSSYKPNPGDRVVPGTNIIIPWPPKADLKYTDNAADTLRISVEDVTFQYPLLGAPMPLSVIDELRNKFSRFRTRHDDDYIAKKTAEEAKIEGRKSLIDSMRTPLEELALLRKQKAQAEQRELTEEQLAGIGRAIEQERAKKAQLASGVGSV